MHALLGLSVMVGVATAVPVAAAPSATVGSLAAAHASAGEAEGVSGDSGAAAEAGEDAALAQAARTGKNVEVLSQRSESGEVYAEPSGALEAVEHVRPVRARVGGGWKDVDTALSKRPDGSLAPGVSTVATSFSGGGSTPLVTLEKAGRRLSLSWPTSLPQPVINGSMATYPSVLPDVDLQMRADVDGVSQVLVVKSPQAAASSQLASLRLAMDAHGLAVGETADGGLAAVDAGAGGEVFEAPQPLMWDSSTSPATSESSARTATGAKTLGTAAGNSADMAEGPGSSSQVAPVDVDVASGGDALVLTPDQELLQKATYPVYIDPQWYTPKAGNWTMVSRYWASSPQWRFNGESDAGMGYCAGDVRCAPEDLKRLFYSVPTSRFIGKSILAATFVANETHSYSCTAKNVQLYRTKGVNKDTTWNSQLADGFWVDLLRTNSEAKGSGCSPAGTVEFWALRAVQQASANGWSTTTFGLKAENEADKYAWKRFADDAYAGGVQPAADRDQDVAAHAEPGWDMLLVRGCGTDAAGAAGQPCDGSGWRPGVHAVPGVLGRGGWQGPRRALDIRGDDDEGLGLRLQHHHALQHSEERRRGVACARLRRGAVVAVVV
ncbi:hypothetical protein [Streptomyces sp. TS71-3]|uniref:hypothetical protein n=1 Tax=Streptomyces sp. TS71-3 TaxID=2733862 RepID=UPI001B2C5A61|nr:hypothetical protein [Streptomyces sp. TS71-3]GHJ37263.1 hypothetical protein Sm713_28720 [Streptomyces sp. TS71-3]